MAPSARAWSVAKLVSLDFTGDADALAAYVDALVENNRDVENADPALLRAQATNDLADFLGKDSAQIFVDGLMRFLADAPGPATPAAPLPASPDHERVTPPDGTTPAIMPDDAPARPTEAPAEPMEHDTRGERDGRDQLNARNARVEPDERVARDERDERARRNEITKREDANGRAPQGARPAQSERPLRAQPERSQARSRAAPLQKLSPPTSSREREWEKSRAQTKPSVIARLGDRSMRDPSHREERGERSERGLTRGYVRGAHPFARGQQGHGADLRDRLAGRRGAKRPRDGEVEGRGEETRDLQGVRDFQGMRDSQEARDLQRRRGDGFGRGDRERSGRYGRREGGERDEGVDRGDRGYPRDAKDRMNGKAMETEKSGGLAPPPFGFPMLTPEMMLKFPPPPHFPPGMMPPPPVPPQFLAAQLEREGRGGFRGGRGGGRGRDGRDGRGRDGNDRETRGPVLGSTGVNTSGKKQYSVLAMRHVPEDKLKLPHILKFLEKYGTPDNVQLVTPDRAFIIYSEREPALAVVKSVDAVMGNRHIRLGWANSQDYDVAGLELTDEGVLKPKSGGGRTGGKRDERRQDRSDKRMPHQGGGRNEASARKEIPEVSDPAEAAALKEREKLAAAKAAEEDLRKKRQAIAAARAEQEERKAVLLAKKKELMESQKALLASMDKSTDSASKLDLLKQAKSADAELRHVTEQLNPANTLSAPSRLPSSDTPHLRTAAIASAGATRGRGRGGRFGGFTVDNRPKTVQIMGAIPGVSKDTAMRVFRETESAEKVGAFWLLKFATRRAAESAFRARGPLKRGFGPGARSQIVQGLPGDANSESVDHSGGSAPAAEQTAAGVADPVAAFAASEKAAASRELAQPAVAAAPRASEEVDAAPVAAQGGMGMQVGGIGQGGSSAMVIDSVEAQPMVE